MFMIYFLKMLSDLGILMSVAGFFALLSGGHGALLLAILPGLALLFAFSGLLTEKGLLRYLPYPAAAAWFLLPGKSWPDILLFAVCLLYVLWQSRRGAYRPDLDRQREIFGLYSKSFILIAVISLIFSYESALAVTLPAGALALVACILLNQSLRHEPRIYQSFRFQLFEGLSMGLVLLGAFFLGSPQVLRGMGAVISFVYHKLIWPVISALIYLFIEFLGLFFGIIKKPVPQGEMIQPSLDPGEGSEWAQMLPEQSQGGRVLLAFLTVALVAVFVYIILIRLRAARLSGDKETRTMSRQSGTVYTSLEKTEEPLPPRGAVRQVRAYYRKYLKWMKERGVHQAGQDTSWDLLVKGRPLAREAEQKELREAYLKARYLGEADEADAARAKEAWKGIRK